jgi:hypothetical protein
LFITLAAAAQDVRFVGVTRYLNNARAVVTHTIDDSTKFVPAAIDAMDKYGIKATIFVSTQRAPIAELWPRLRQAIADGHEIGSHSRTHQCKWPATTEFCDGAYSEPELAGSRDDILKNTGQPYVWTWCYPCGVCAEFDFIHGRIARAGYLVARTYPGEMEDKHNLPDLQSYGDNAYAAAYTQAVQKKGGIAKTGRTDVAEVNAKFDEVHRKGGIYSFLSHPQWLDFGGDGFYERHLAHLANRPDVWYVPMGPLYAHRALRERTQVRPTGRHRFTATHDLDPKIYGNAVTLEFAAPKGLRALARGAALPERGAGPTSRWSEEFVRWEGGRAFVTVRPNVDIEFRE